MLLDENPTPDRERIIKWATAGLFGAGSDTVRRSIIHTTRRESHLHI
jgi:hypothetical protein